ncbi:MAG TPA: RNA polymerase sigma factor [Spirochaetota bacterium]|nr:RNA polymerase sigma factor [Spirochaetota bacterium]HPF06844.1 RNA polymerase sigma factor [Spirochaetota bacterium]HPJ42189.1 RNA polymerase sigma factor [Spirochaetota bacterium]HPR38871.1 RNA polymerase sigma factor [Spirochaetota bacterium]HRX48036.1 RNA polymerase sigma factor [Spirochaetota bacterium]
MSPINDIEIINRVLEGDKSAFADIIKKYQNMVFRYVYYQFGNYDEALDITQDIFITVMEALGSFRQESKFSTWLYSIMVNHCKNYKKKNSRYSTVPLKIFRGDEEVDLQLQDTRENPEERIINEDSLRILKEEINKLPEDFREILTLRDIEGLSYNEISDILGINLSNVKVRIHRGREYLKNRLHARGLV